MKKYLAGAFVLTLLLGAGCASDDQRTAATNNNTEANTNTNQAAPAAAVALPVPGYAEHRTGKKFGDAGTGAYQGFHTGDDIEYSNPKDTVTVSSIADGSVVYIGRPAGYSGVVIVRSTIDTKTINAVFAQIDLSTVTLKVGDAVTKGQPLGDLATPGTANAVSKIKQLHFALYEGTAIRSTGYVSDKAALTSWINPQDFFSAHGIALNVK